MSDLSHYPYISVWLSVAWLYFFGIPIWAGARLLWIHPASLRSWFARGMIAIEVASSLVGFYLVLVLSIHTPKPVDEILLGWSIGGGALGIIFVAFLHRMENERRRARGEPVI